MHAAEGCTAAAALLQVYIVYIYIHIYVINVASGERDSQSGGSYCSSIEEGTRKASEFCPARKRPQFTNATHQTAPCQRAEQLNEGFKATIHLQLCRMHVLYPYRPRFFRGTSTLPPYRISSCRPPSLLTALSLRLTPAAGTTEPTLAATPDDACLAAPLHPSFVHPEELTDLS